MTVTSQMVENNNYLSDYCKRKFFFHVLHRAQTTEQRHGTAGSSPGAPLHPHGNHQSTASCLPGLEIFIQKVSSLTFPASLPLSHDQVQIIM